MKKIKKKNWMIIAVILLVATIIDIFVPDPVPFVDEILLVFFSIFSFYKSLKKKK